MGRRPEADRLIALPVAELGAAIIGAFGPGGLPTTGGRRIGVLGIANWLMKPVPRGASHLQRLLNPVREGVQALENAGLVMRHHEGEGASSLTVTRTGESALAEGSVRQHLGLS